MKKLYYEITQNGYHIYDYDDSLFHIHQYEPFIPDKTKSYEENAQIQISSILIPDYAYAVFTEDITIEDVPEEYREVVATVVLEIKNRKAAEEARHEMKQKAQAYDILMGVSE